MRPGEQRSGRRGAHRRRAGRAVAGRGCERASRSRGRVRALRLSAAGRVERPCGARAACRGARDRVCSRAGRSEPVEQPRPCQATELAAKRLGRRDQQRMELIEPGSLRDRRTFTSGHQRAQRLSLAAAARYRAALLGEHAPCGANRVERIRLAARTAFATKSTDLEHLLVPVEQNRLRPAPNEAVPSIANARRPGACSPATRSASA